MVFTVPYTEEDQTKTQRRVWVSEREETQTKFQPNQRLAENAGQLHCHQKAFIQI